MRNTAQTAFNFNFSITLDLVSWIQLHAEETQECYYMYYDFIAKNVSTDCMSQSEK